MPSCEGTIPRKCFAFPCVGNYYDIRHNMIMLKAPGVNGFFKFLSMNRIIRKLRGFSAIESLPHKHAAFHLTQSSAIFHKMQCLCRTIPRSLIGPCLDFFHDRMKRCLELSLRTILTRTQWSYAKYLQTILDLHLAFPVSN